MSAQESSVAGRRYDQELLPVGADGQLKPMPRAMMRPEPRLATTLRDNTDVMCGCLGSTFGMSFGGYADFDEEVARLQAQEEGGDVSAANMQFPLPPSFQYGLCADIECAYDDEDIGAPQDDEGPTEIGYTRDLPAAPDAVEAPEKAAEIAATVSGIPR
ncbi:hypothetical protein M885DRAFT_506324 [Pelagophyceae sp. CCMP2097]|nr:hypothetical protein M885DRAFT_506324 [Pelagophyceae sp. CCMP2097]|mmetsp:Transcript_9563/g.31605  ORF Transcript_9563/g.31605 Transcript_9563/m.31605 type:complete len:159 (-) Transcript_9563:115-591(-)